MPAPRHVLLDLDGTLIDPKPGIVGSVLFALRELGVAPPAGDDLTWCIGPPLRVTFGRLLGEARAEAGVALYRENYRNGAMYEADVYPGIPAALHALQDQGHRLVVVTAKPHVFARPIVERLGLALHLDAVYGPELDGTHDDKADLLAHVLAAERLAPEHAVMVGDRKFDILAAQRNGVRGIGITWGYGAPAELLEAGATDLCEAPAHLPRLLAALPPAT